MAKTITSVSLSSRTVKMLEDLTNLYDCSRTTAVERSIRETWQKEKQAEQEWPIRTTEDRETYSTG